MSAYREFPKNQTGRDFVVGDIHGCYDLLDQALQAVDFDPERDRLFSVGDLTDRGKFSVRALEFLEKPWFFAVRGNHDEHFLDMVTADGVFLKHLFDMDDHDLYGTHWIETTPRETLQALRAHLANLPYAIAFDSAVGKIGIVHAEIHRKYDWLTFSARIGDADRNAGLLRKWATSSRMRIYGDVDDDIPGNLGIDRLFCGHTIQDGGPTQRGNVFYIDTGAYQGLSLTFANAVAPDADIIRPIKGRYTPNICGVPGIGPK